MYKVIFPVIKKRKTILTNDNIHVTTLSVKFKIEVYNQNI